MEQAKLSATARREQMAARFKPGGDKFESIKNDKAQERAERVDHAEKYGRGIDVWEAKNVE